MYIHDPHWCHLNVQVLISDSPPIVLHTMFTFNATFGFVDGLIRGLRSSFLTSDDYTSLVESGTFDGMSTALLDPVVYAFRYAHAWLAMYDLTIAFSDIRLNLLETDYADILDDADHTVCAAVLHLQAAALTPRHIPELTMTHFHSACLAVVCDHHA